LLLAACQDYGFQRPERDPEGGPQDTAPERDTGRWLPELPLTVSGVDPCNGLDDDDDGLVDEGFPDSDQDGEADCVDVDFCEIEIAHAGVAASDGACHLDQLLDPDIGMAAVEWRWSGVIGDEDRRHVTAAPVAAPMVDTDGDGDVDSDDVPRVAFVAWDDLWSNDGTLVVVDGASGEEVFHRDEIHCWFGVAIADVDGDGSSEVIAVNGSSRVVAISADGSELWESGSTVGGFHAQPLVADLEGDGVVEVLVDDVVFSGLDGSTILDLELGGTPAYRLGAVADLDLDGDQEIALAAKLYDHLGNELWEAQPVAGDTVVKSAIVQADEDAEGEVIFLGESAYTLYDVDGTKLAEERLPVGSFPSPPCVADFDGDGSSEVAFTYGEVLRVMDPDGTEIWHARFSDSSTRSACSGFDFEDDGAFELLYADEEAFYVLDGATGEVLLQADEHQSITGIEYPSVVDVDADGSAEILVASSMMYSIDEDGWLGVTAIGASDLSWPRGGTSWNSYDFAVTNILADGSVPSLPAEFWEDPGVYRARPAGGNPAPDLALEITDVCWTGCVDDSAVQLSVAVSNHGAEAAAAPVSVTLYRVDDGVETAVQVLALEEDIDAGWSSAGLVFEVTRGEVGGEGFVVRVDDDGTGAGALEECDEVNNEATWDGLGC